MNVCVSEKLQREMRENIKLTTAFSEWTESTNTTYITQLQILSTTEGQTQICTL